MKQASLLLLPGLCLFAGCVADEHATGLQTVSCNQLGTPSSYTVARTSLSAADSEWAGKVYFVGREIVARNKNCGLDANLTFVTYPSPAVEIFHPNRTQVYVTEGLVRKCSQEQLAAVLANELGKISAERIVAAPYLDVRDVQCPAVHSETGSDKSFFPAEWDRYDGQTHVHKQPRPEPRKLAQALLERAGYSRGLLDNVQTLLDEASQNHSVERRMKGLPLESGWQP